MKLNLLNVRNSPTYITMFAQVMNVQPKQGNWGPQADCTVVDDNNETGVITVSLSKPPKVSMLPTVNHIGQRLSFTVKAKQAGSKIYYNGFWNHTASVLQPPPQIPQQPMPQYPPPQFAPPQPQFAPQPQQTAMPAAQPVRQSVQMDGRNTSIEKQCCLKSAVEYVNKTPDGTVDDVIFAAWRFYLDFVSAAEPKQGVFEDAAEEPNFPNENN